MAPRPCWGSRIGLGHDNGLTLAARFGATEKSQANQNREKMRPHCGRIFASAHIFLIMVGAKKRPQFFPGFETVANKCEGPHAIFPKRPFQKAPGKALSRNHQDATGAGAPGPRKPSFPRRPQEGSSQGTSGEPPGAFWELLKIAGSLWELPEASGDFWEPSGSFRELPRASRNLREPPGAFGSLWNIWELPKDSKSSRRPPGAFRGPPGVFGNP